MNVLALDSDLKSVREVTQNVCLYVCVCVREGETNGGEYRITRMLIRRAVLLIFPIIAHY